MRIGLVGGGVIGGGWAGRLVQQGIDVAVYDPAPDAAERLGEVLDNAERAWARLTLAPRARGSVVFTPTLAEAVAGADVVQESTPEDERLKRRVLAEIGEHAPAEALVCSSTSGLLPTRLQDGMAHPERFVVGHPFNPVYLLPLVEVCGGERTSPETVARAVAFYESIGMRPLVVRQEIDGFVADRLLEALWREALWLVHDGVATAEEVDDAIRFGAGLRWAQMGTFLTYRIAGGTLGMRHFMAQFGPTLQWPWSKLTDVPELTDELLDTICSQSDEQAGGLTVRELERIRDDNLVAILQALRSCDWGAGAVLAEHERSLFDRAPAVGVADPAAPLRLTELVVDPAWVDYNGHLTEGRYGEVLASGTDGFLRHAGLDAAYLERGHSFYTVETHIRYLGEVGAFEPLAVETQVLGADEKRLHLFHTLVHVQTGAVLATGEHVLLHVDTAAGRSCPILDPLASAVAAAAAAHAGLPVPEGAGRSIGLT